MKITRRGFLKAAGGTGLAVATGTLRWPHRVAAGSSTTLRLLGHSAFNEARDKAIAKIGNDFAAQHNSTFAGDFIDQPEVAAKLTAEEQAKSGTTSSTCRTTCRRFTRTTSCRWMMWSATSPSSSGISTRWPKTPGMWTGTG